MLNSCSEKIIIRCQILDEKGYWKRHDIYESCDSMNEIGKVAWKIRLKQLDKNERGYFTFRKVLLA